MTYYQIYVLEVFCSIYEVSFDDIKLSISSGNLILEDNSDGFFTTDQVHPKKITSTNWLNQKIPILFSENSDLPVIENHSEVVKLNYDILSSAFFFLSSWQEIKCLQRDQHGRYMYKNSLHYELNINSIPVVNYYFDILKTALESVLNTSIPYCEKVPNSIQVCLSHDIDKINSGWLEGGFSELKKGRLWSVFKLLSQKLIGSDPWNNIDEILSIEKNLSVNSTFFFLMKHGGGNADYKPKEVQHYFDQINIQGSEIAIHGSLGSAESASKLVEDIKLIPDQVSGNRFHYLKYEPVTVGNTLENAGLNYDGTFGFAEHIGFRHGICFPFHPFNFETKQKHSFIEIPLTIMDATLSHKSYMGNDESKNQKLNFLISEIEKFNGVLSILWHNNYFSKYKYFGWKDRYIELVTNLKSKNAKFYTHKSLAALYDA